MSAVSLSQLPPAALTDPLSKIKVDATSSNPPSKVTSCALEALSRSDLDLFKSKLLKIYSPKVVKALFEKLEKLGKKNLTEADQERFEVWCHYFDVETRFREEIHGTKSAKSRLLNHYLRYSQREVYRYISRRSLTEGLSHEHIVRCESNISRYLEYQKELVETFGEELCHKALTKIPILPSEVLLGQESFPDLEDFKSTIYQYYEKEIVLRERIESGSYEELKEQAEEIKQDLSSIKSYSVAQELFLKLAIKSGRVDWLKSPFPKSLIQSQAELFEACRLADVWVDEQDELLPIPGAGARPSQTNGPINQNMVYFLKNPYSTKSSPPVAVFKNSKEAASLEKLVYDAAVIFGFESAFVPTKLKKFKGKPGSVQVFQEGLSWSEFLQLGKEKSESPHPNALETPPSKEAESTDGFLRIEGSKVVLDIKEPEETKIQDKIIRSISMEDFLKAGIASLLFGNRDLHAGNFFFVPKSDGNYKIVMFDNEMSFYHSNYVLVDKKGMCHLPVRNSLLIFPQADTPIEGDLKKKVQRFVSGFENKFKEFCKYLDSHAGKETLKGLPKRKLGHYQIKAFKTRIEKLVKMMKSGKDYTFRDMVYRLFPFYESYLQLVKFLFPDHPEMMVGYHCAEELCDEVIKMGYMTEEKKKNFIQEIKKYKYK